MFTSPDIVALSSPSTISFPIAPNSSYFVPASIVISLFPFNIISGAVVSITFTFLVRVDEFSELSVAV